VGGIGPGPFAGLMLADLLRGRRQLAVDLNDPGMTSQTRTGPASSAANAWSNSEPRETSPARLTQARAPAT
jgi:hypothetical protein